MSYQLSGTGSYTALPSIQFTSSNYASAYSTGISGTPFSAGTATSVTIRAIAAPWADGDTTDTGPYTATARTSTDCPTPTPTPTATPQSSVLAATGTPSLPPTSGLSGQGGQPDRGLLLLVGLIGGASLAPVTLSLLRARLLDRIER